MRDLRIINLCIMAATIIALLLTAPLAGTFLTGKAMLNRGH
jgi:hypothetical protein